MCGIIGYVGERCAEPIIVSGLKRLEYRGYDSAGIAVFDPAENALRWEKNAGKVADLEERLRQFPASAKNATLGVGHTRWATHGEPTRNNAHPHLGPSGRIAVVHNGIIENFHPLKEKLLAAGNRFASDTDTEVIAHLVELHYEGDLQAAVIKALEQIQGAYGLVVISADHPGELVAARSGSPIVVGVCEGETLVASDVSALVSHTSRAIYLHDGDVLRASLDNLDISSIRNTPISRDATDIDWSVDEIEKGSFEHFVLKEIHEQPEALTNTLRGRLDFADASTKLSGMQMEPRERAQIDRMIIAACGTSMYAGMIGKYLFEDFADIPTDVMQAAEFRDRNPIIQRASCLLAISQSGETADTLAAVREAIRKGATTLGVCNVVGSTIARETGRGVYLHAGPEIGVASTKAFTCQVVVLAMMAIALGRTRRMSAEKGAELIDELSRLPELARRVIETEPRIVEVAKKYSDVRNAFFIGRGYLYPAVLEGALKLKEISYIHAEGYHAAELKHGPLALLGEGVPVIVAVPRSSGRNKTIANMQECRARKSPVVAIATEGDDEIANHADDVLYVPECREFMAPVPVVIVEQLLAYHVARLRGCEIDQPRNLAKAVTVE